MIKLFPSRGGVRSKKVNNIIADDFLPVKIKAPELTVFQLMGNCMGPFKTPSILFLTA
jgi:hypothetical protein